MTAATAAQIAAAPTKDECLAGDFIDTPIACKRLGVSMTTLHRMMDAGHIVYLRVGPSKTKRSVSVLSLEHYRSTNIVVRTSATKH